MPRQLNDEQWIALGLFLEMDRHFWYDNAHHYTCTEADRAAELLRAFGQHDVARNFLKDHAEEDDEGDDHNPDGSPRSTQYNLDMGNVGIPEGVLPVRCPHGVNTWPGHECGDCDA